MPSPVKRFLILLAVLWSTGMLLLFLVIDRFLLSRNNEDDGECD